MQELVYVHGMKPGHGVNLLNGNTLANTAVEGTLTPVQFAEGQNVKSQFIKIDDMSSLHKSLGIEVTASGSYMGFSANAKVDFADECNFNSHSTYVMIHVEVTNAFVSMDNPVLSSDATELLKNKLPERFRERFGDVFIVGVNTGGEYFAIYQISGTDEKEKEQVSVAVSASFQGLIASGDFGLKINSLTENSQSHLEVKVFNFQLGGSDPSTDLTAEQMMTKARSFAQSVRGDFSVPYSMLPASYKELKLPDDAANPIDIENQRQALADAWKIRNELMALKNDIDYILLSDAHNHDEFEPFNVQELTAARNQLAHQIDTITKGASQCMVDAKQCQFAEFDTSAIKLPNRKAGAAEQLPPGLIRAPDQTGTDCVEAVKRLRALFGPIHITVFSEERDASQEGKVVGEAPPPRSVQAFVRGIRLFRGMVSAHMPDATSHELAALGIQETKI